MKNKYKFKLLTSIASDNKTKIYRYSSVAYHDPFMWRETSEEAKNDVYRFFINFCDRAKGIKEMFEIDNIKKYNQKLVK